MRYARIHHKAGASRDVGKLLEENPLAVALFFLAVARADLYGILPGDAWAFRVHVVPAAALQEDEVEVAIKAMEDLGLVQRYRAGDRELMHIVRYHDYQEVRWEKGVGPPDEELPEWWKPPEGFVRWLCSEACKKIRKNAAKWTELRARFNSAPGEHQENTRSKSERSGQNVNTADNHASGQTTETLQENSRGPLGEHRHTDVDFKKATHSLPPLTPPSQSTSMAEEGAHLNSALNGERPPPNALLDEALQLIADCCKDGTTPDHAGIRRAVEDQAAQDRHHTFIRERATATYQWGIAAKEAGATKAIHRVTGYFTAACNGEWHEWIRNRLNPWELANGPPPKDAVDAAFYYEARASWLRGKPDPKYQEPSEPPPAQEGTL